MFYKFFTFKGFDLESFRTQLSHVEFVPDNTYYLSLFSSSGERVGSIISFSLTQMNSRDQLIQELYNKISIIISFLLFEFSSDHEKSGFTVCISES